MYFQTARHGLNLTGVKRMVGSSCVTEYSWPNITSLVFRISWSASAVPLWAFPSWVQVNFLVLSSVVKFDLKRSNFFRTKNRILEATVKTGLQTTEGELLLFRFLFSREFVFQRICLQMVSGIQLTERISSNNMYEKYGSIPISRAMMRERPRWLGHILRIDNDRSPKIVLISLLSRTKRKSDRSRTGWKDVLRKDLREMRAIREGKNKFWIDWDGGGACVAVLGSGGLMLQRVSSSS